MILYLLDYDFSRIMSIDLYESLIWTNRYLGYGDFELRMSFIGQTLDLINMITEKKSKSLDLYFSLEGDLMIIETFEISSNVESGYHVIISGRGLESILERRIIWTTTNINGNLQNGIKKLIDDAFINPSDTNRKLSNFIFESSSNVDITKLTMTSQFTGDNLYETIYSICEESNLGFNIILNQNNTFVFKLVKGENRAFDQTINPYVIFSPKYDNLISSDYINSSKTLKNIALVAGEEFEKGTPASKWNVNRDASYSFVNTENEPNVWKSNNQAKQSTTAKTTWTYTPTSTQELIIKWSVSSESSYDKIFISLNGNTKVNYISGEQSGSFTEVLQPNTLYTLIATYSKDVSIDRGTDTATVIFDHVVDRRKTTVSDGSSQTGLSRKELFVDARDLQSESDNKTLTSDEYVSILSQRGKEKLSENTYTYAFTGEIEPTKTFEYGRDFYIGDIVQIQNEFGMSIKAMIIEVVTSHDVSGQYTYPTFKILNS